MRIAFDVSPLSHERTGVNNYIRGSLARPRRGRERARRRHRRVRADLPLRQARHPGDARRDRRRASARDTPVRTRLAHRVVGDRSPRDRALDRPVRRAALQRLDVSAAAGRRPRDDDPRPRARPPSRVDHGPHARNARTQVQERSRHVQCRLRQLVVHRRRLCTDDRLRARARARRASGGRRGVQRGRRGRQARAAVPAHGRHARAPQESRHARRRVRVARRYGPVARRRRRQWLGRSARARPARHPPPGARRRRGAGPVVSRGRRRRLSVAVRGIRNADHRGDGLGCTGRRLGASVDGRGGRRRCGSRRPREPGGNCSRDSRGSRPARRAAASRPGARRAILLASRGRSLSRGVPQFA